MKVMSRRSLENAIEKFKEKCERCGEPLVVHGFRQKSHGQKEKIYASCYNKGVCPKFGAEICFIEKFF